MAKKNINFVQNIRKGSLVTKFDKRKHNGNVNGKDGLEE